MSGRQQNEECEKQETMSSMNKRIVITVNRIKACSTDNYKLLQLIKLYNKSLKKSMKLN